MDATLLFEWLVAEAERLPEPVRDWLLTGRRRWLMGESLEAALNLSVRPGHRRPATKARMAERDHYLRQAWQFTPGNTPWTRARYLAEGIGRLPVVYRRYQQGHAPLTAQNRALCQARDYGRLPENPRRLQAICEASAIFSIQRPGEMIAPSIHREPFNEPTRTPGAVTSAV